MSFIENEDKKAYICNANSVDDPSNPGEDREVKASAVNEPSNPGEGRDVKASAVDEPSNASEDRDAEASNDDIEMYVNGLDYRQTQIKSVTYLIAHPSKYILECVINSMTPENDVTSAKFYKVYVITKILRDSGLGELPWEKYPLKKRMVGEISQY